MKPRRVALTPTDLRAAAKRLDGMSVNQAAMLRVAKFLRKEADRRELEKLYKEEAAERGIPLTVLRRSLKRELFGS